MPRSTHILIQRPEMYQMGVVDELISEYSSRRSKHWRVLASFLNIMVVRSAMALALKFSARTMASGFSLNNDSSDIANTTWSMNR